VSLTASHIDCHSVSGPHLVGRDRGPLPAFGSSQPFLEALFVGGHFQSVLVFLYCLVEFGHMDIRVSQPAERAGEGHLHQQKKKKVQWLTAKSILE
jgi:hypothetical protein